MKAGDLIDLLMTYQNDDEIKIEVCETTSSLYVDTTASVFVVKGNTFVSMLRIDGEVDKFKKFL